MKITTFEFILATAATLVLIASCAIFAFFFAVGTGHPFMNFFAGFLVLFGFLAWLISKCTAGNNAHITVIGSMFSDQTEGDTSDMTGFELESFYNRPGEEG